MLGRPNRRNPCWTLILCLAVAGASTGWAATSAPAGAVVEGLGHELRPDQVAVRPGDLITAWTRGDGRGSIRSPFDLWPLSVEQLPRGPVVLNVTRDGQPTTVTIPPSAWPFEIETRPAFEADVLAAYEEGRRLVQEKKTEDGVRAWRALLGKVQESDPVAACWLLARAGKAWAEAGRRSEFDAAYAAALQCAREQEPGLAVAMRMEQAGQALEREWPDAAADGFRALLEEEEALAGPLSKAEVLFGLSRVRHFQSRAPESIDLLRQALTLQEVEAAESLSVARSLARLSFGLQIIGEVDDAERLVVRAEALAARIGPGTITHGVALRILGGSAYNRGDLLTAQRLWERALQLDPLDAVQRTSVLLNLGVAAAARGDLETAESWIRQGLELSERDGRPYRGLLENLADVVRSRGDLEEAERLLRRALSDNGVQNLYWLVYQLTNLGEIRLERSDAAEAKALFEQAAATAEKRSFGGMFLAWPLAQLAGIARRERDWTTAEALYGRALSAVSVAEPSGYLAAESLHGLGRVHRARGRDAEAADCLARAVAALEAMRGQTASSDEARSLRHSQYHAVYHDHAEVLVKTGRVEDAFVALERSRARALLSLLAERDLILDDDIPLELERRRRRVNADYQGTHAALLKLPEGGDAAKREALSVRLTDLRRQQIEIADKIRAASPRLAEARYPEPLSLAEIQAALEPGTLLLAYSTGEDGTLLFAVTRDAIEAVAIPLGEAELRRRIDGWRKLAERSVPRPEFYREARDLYSLLLGPVDRQWAGARRVLISPAGPLHALPFAALRRGGRFLADGKPLTIVPSGTLYAQWVKSRREARTICAVAGFADPSRPAAGFEALPESRRELEAVVGACPKAARRYAGDAATEEQAKRLGKDARYVHFACHGLINERRPLDSGLVLHVAQGKAGDDGLLQAWEIYERVRIDADLVTLSACRSASGTVRAGEGLLGLTRAFQYAGARSVLASLWSLGDASTLWFMERFYGELARGVPKDEALQQTQRAAIRAGHHPIRWAAYQLYGDWR